MLDFPNTPQIGDILNGPSGQQWVWTGIKWANSIIGGAALVPEPPNDGTAYLRSNGAWVPMTSFSQKVSAVVNLPSGTVYQDAVVINVGSTGVWFVSSFSSFQSGTALTSFFSRITDGTNIIGTATATASAASLNASTSVSGILINPLGPLRLQGATNNVASTMTLGTGLTAMRIG